MVIVEGAQAHTTSAVFYIYGAVVISYRYMRCYDDRHVTADGAMLPAMLTCLNTAAQNTYAQPTSSMPNPGGSNGHYNGVRKSYSFSICSCLFTTFSGPPDEQLRAILHGYALRGLSLNERIMSLEKQEGYKIRYVVSVIQ